MPTLRLCSSLTSQWPVDLLWLKWQHADAADAAADDDET
jgi:hypothetical protein